MLQSHRRATQVVVGVGPIEVDATAEEDAGPDAQTKRKTEDDDGDEDAPRATSAEMHRSIVAGILLL